MHFLVFYQDILGTKCVVNLLHAVRKGILTGHCHDVKGVWRPWFMRTHVGEGVFLCSSERAESIFLSCILSISLSIK